MSYERDSGVFLQRFINPKGSNFELSLSQFYLVNAIKFNIIKVLNEKGEMLGSEKLHIQQSK